MGCRTLLTTISLEAVAQMSCNPAVGGTAKGIAVREVDALGGAQGFITDRSGIQFKMLNRSRGPAVQSPRAQCDKRLFAILMKQLIERSPNLALRQEMIEELLVEEVGGGAENVTRYRERLKRLRDGVAPNELGIAPPDAGKLRVAGIRAGSGLTYTAETVILTTGTFLRGLIHQGTKQSRGGRAGEVASMSLSGSLEALGFELRRLKTGTPPRLNGRTLKFKGLEEQWGDEPPTPFSFRTKKIERPSMCCYITRTTARTHEIIRANLDRAPLYTGQIHGVGPRYCPSVEDKVVKFGEKESHQVFLEPEGADTEEFYVNGLSTSLPPDVQFDLIHSVPGCENAEVLRFGYAIEYDMVPPHQIVETLGTKRVGNLYLAGQINGTSGYEEAAAQGVMAGINAALCVKSAGKETLVLGRDEAYLGILIDDLVTKDITEPYRLFTSRSEYRLLLRQDNADRRLAAHAKRLGLIDNVAFDAVTTKQAAIDLAAGWMKSHRPAGSHKNYWDTLRMPNMSLDLVGLSVDEAGKVSVRPPGEFFASEAPLNPVAEALQVEAKYEGYLKKQTEQIERMKEIENRLIPESVDYKAVGLGREAVEKLNRHRPRTFGQALRLEGVTPADVSLLSIHVAQRKL